MVNFNNLDIKKIVVFGGTGAQGSPIVRELSASGRFTITIPTRDPSSTSAQNIAALPHVHLLLADYTTTFGLRSIFTSQDACYFSLNSFSLLESTEYFLTFRAYELAIQSGLKWFVYSGSPDRLRQYGFKEEYRNSHGVVSGRLSEWLAGQDEGMMRWTVLSGGVYAQMLGSLLRPTKVVGEGGEDCWEFAAPIGRGRIPFVDLEDYGVRTRWVFEHPAKCVGMTLGWAPWWTSYAELATAFQNITGEKAVFRNIEQDEWFERMRPYVDPEMLLPPGVAEADKEMAWSFRSTFGAWWRLWRDVDQIWDEEGEEEKIVWSNKVAPGRMKSIEEWMKKTKYNGDFKEVQKAKGEADGQEA